MDAITTIAASVDNPAIRAIGMIIDDNWIYAILILVLILIGERREEKRAKIIFSLLLAALLGLMMKHVIAQERPCFGEEWCPDDYALPSLHATVAFTLMVAFLNKKSYLGYLVFALFVAFTRLNIGVHTFYDVAGALPVALLSYYITTVLFERREKKWKRK